MTVGGNARSGRTNSSAGGRKAWNTNLFTKVVCGQLDSHMEQILWGLARKGLSVKFAFVYKVLSS